MHMVDFTNCACMRNPQAEDGNVAFALGAGVFTSFTASYTFVVGDLNLQPWAGTCWSSPGFVFGATGG